MDLKTGSVVVIVAGQLRRLHATVAMRDTSAAKVVIGWVSHHCHNPLKAKARKGAELASSARGANNHRPPRALDPSPGVAGSRSSTQVHALGGTALCRPVATWPKALRRTCFACTVPWYISACPFFKLEITPGSPYADVHGCDDGQKQKQNS